MQLGKSIRDFSSLRDIKSKFQKCKQQQSIKKVVGHVEISSIKVISRKSKPTNVQTLRQLQLQYHILRVLGFSRTR